MDQTKIMIVEDESIVALDLKNKLQKLGYAVTGRAKNGLDAINKVEENCPDLALMDIRIKGDMDGIETAERIQAQFDIPIIYLTAHSDEATLKRAKLTKPAGYLIKPFEDRELHSTITMALHRHQIDRELDESRRWLATTLNSIGDGVIATDERGWIKFMNPVAERLTGWTESEAMGRDSGEIFNIVYDGNAQKPCESPVTKVLQQNIVVELESNTHLITKNGQKVPIDDSASPIRDDQGRLNGVVIVFRDVTERQQTEEKLRRYALELEQQNADLNAFAHTVAHDLKIPLVPIIGFTDFLLTDAQQMGLNQDVQKQLGTICRSARKMSNVIEELLLLARMSQADVTVSPLQMAEVVTEATNRLAYMIEESKAKIVIPTEAAWPSALGYAPWVEEIWINYLSNGLKYGGNPPCLKLGGEVQSDGMVRFWVHDNGPGLDPQQQASLFVPFTRLDQTRVTGHGLGLSIVQRIVDKLGGQAGIESNGRSGGGSIFYFTLPPVAA